MRESSSDARDAPPLSLRGTGSVAEIRERQHVHDQRDPDQREQRARLAARGATVEKRDEQEDRPAEAEADDADDLPFDTQDVAREVLERLEHEHEVPLGLDAHRRRRERIGFLPQLGGEEGRQRRQDGDGREPSRSTPGGTLIPCFWTRYRWRPRASVTSAGRTATWMP